MHHHQVTTDQNKVHWIIVNNSEPLKQPVNKDEPDVIKERDEVNLLCDGLLGSDCGGFESFHHCEFEFLSYETTRF